MAGRVAADQVLVHPKRSFDVDEVPGADIAARYLVGELTIEEAVAQALGEAAPVVDELGGTVRARP